MEILMFPGQGSQQLGMGKNLFPQYPELCRAADDILGYSITSLCIEDVHGTLNQTVYTQPAIYFVCCLMYLDHVKRSDRPYNYLIGHSLGLFPTLFAAGVFDLLEGLEIVAKRGQLMQAVTGGGMLAVLGEQIERVHEKLIRYEFFDIDVANYNSTEQLILSGKTDRIKQLSPLLETEGYHCVSLPVSGAFHSRYMEPCRLKFVDFLMQRTLAPPKKKVISSTSGEILGAEHLIEEISFQLVKPVRWLQTVRSILQRFSDVAFTELGPGRVLTNLQEKIL